jgi:N-acetyltransferase
VPSSPWPEAVTLTGSHAVLVPLSQDHAADLAKAVAEGDLHRLWNTSIPAPDQVPEEIDRRLALRAAGAMLPFAVLDPGSGGRWA